MCLFFSIELHLPLHSSESDSHRCLGGIPIHPIAIAAIRSDIATADQALKLPEYAACAELPDFRACLAAPAADDDDGGFSFMAPPEGYECEDEEECVLPDDDDEE